jgi:NAD+ synthase (glutamine-hydrolysing)
VKIALAQINPTVGDFKGNLNKIVDVSRRAADKGARLTVFSELAICGYPPADFLEKPSFLARCSEAVRELADRTQGLTTAVLAGVALPVENVTGKRVANAAVLLDKGKLLLEQHKRLLPFYDVFDEQRYFVPARSQNIVELDGHRLAVTICEDAWNDKNFWPRRLYTVDPVEELMKEKPEILINLSASPYWHSKRYVRRRMLSAIAEAHHVPVVMVNQVGGNDSLLFDGSSLVLNANGEVISKAKSFEEDLLIIEPLDRQALPVHETEEFDEEATWKALVMGTRDYVLKCGFTRVLIALSGGIDSALVAAIAAEALGPENVMAIGMPSPYSSEGSISDSRELAKNLGIQFELIEITQLFEDFGEALTPVFAAAKAGAVAGLTAENLQPRIRGVLLMALSNKLSALVLSTGNKSEMAVGYCTLYGDMVGALAVIGDLVKTRVYSVCRWLNRTHTVIPESILTKPPSAELRPDQKDTDSLPPYETLDPIVEAYVERYETPEQIADAYGFALPLVQQIVRLIERSEYKRQQAAPVLKITPKSFGMGRRFPIAVKVEV